MINFNHINLEVAIPAPPASPLITLEDVSVIPDDLREKSPEIELSTVQLSTTKSLIKTLTLNNLSPFVTNINFNQIQLEHPQEMNALSINYQGGSQEINVRFGDDPEALRISCQCTAQAVDLITNEPIMLNVTFSVTNTKVTY